MSWEKAAAHSAKRPGSCESHRLFIDLVRHKGHGIKGTVIHFTSVNSIIQFKGW